MCHATFRVLRANSMARYVSTKIEQVKKEKKEHIDKATIHLTEEFLAEIS